MKRRRAAARKAVAALREPALAKIGRQMRTMFRFPGCGVKANADAICGAPNPRKFRATPTCFQQSPSPRGASEQMTTQSEGPQLRPTRAAWDAPNTAWVSTRYARKWAPASMREPAANWIGAERAPSRSHRRGLMGVATPRWRRLAPPVSLPAGSDSLAGHSDRPEFGLD